jgi:hypothetical protein
MTETGREAGRKIKFISVISESFYTKSKYCVEFLEKCTASKIFLNIEYF